MHFHPGPQDSLPNPSAFTKICGDFGCYVQELVALLKVTCKGDFIPLKHAEINLELDIGCVRASVPIFTSFSLLWGGKASDIP